MSKKMNEIRIRNVDACAVAKIDELAKQKGMSRNQYIKLMIESLSVLDEVKDIQTDYKNLVLDLAEVIEKNTNELMKIQAIINQ